MTTIDFDNTAPNFTFGALKWYLCKELQSYLQREQEFNLPSLNNMAVFIVIGANEKGDNIRDLVLINDKQDIISSYPYTSAGWEQMEFKIKVLKIAKYYEQHESV